MSESPKSKFLGIILKEMNSLPNFFYSVLTTGVPGAWVTLSSGRSSLEQLCSFRISKLAPIALLFRKSKVCHKRQGLGGPWPHTYPPEKQKQTKAKFLPLEQSSRLSENYIPEINILTHLTEGERAEEVSVSASPGKS